MKFNQWTVALATAGVVSLSSALAGESSPVNSMLSGVTLSGYVDTSAIWNFGSGLGTANRFASTGADRQDGFNLNVVQIALEKPLDEGTWSAGYRAELWFGPDASALPGQLGGMGDSDDLAIKQAYVSLRAPVGNGLDFKIGQFDPIIGYEVASSYVNPNFSRSFGFNLEPLSHTGILATYQFTDWFGASVGVANSGALGNGNLRANSVAGKESTKSFIGGITVKAPESWGFLAGSSLYAGVVDGGVVGVDDTENIYVGASIATPVEGLTVGASYDYLGNGSLVPGAESNANAYAVYLSFQVREDLKLSYRAELANSDHNVFGTLQPGVSTDNETVMGHTLTVDYSLWKNVITRAELRWDRSVDGDKPFTNASGSGKSSDISLLANIIYLF